MMTWLFVLVGFIPLIFLPRVIFNCFSLPQICALGLLSSLGAVLGVVNGIVPFSTPSILIFLFLMYIVLSLLWINPIHNGRKELGLQAPLLILFLLASVYLTKTSIGIVTGCIVISGFLSSLYAYGQTKGIDWFFPNDIKQGGKPTNAIGTIGNSNFLCSYLSGVVWLGFYAAVEVRPFFGILSLFCLFIIYKTKSRAGQLGVIGSLLFFVLVLSFFEKIPSIIFPIGLGIIALSAILISYILYSNWEKFWHSEIDPNGPYIWYASFRYRLCYWWAAWELIKRKPLFGWGMWSYRKEVYMAQAQINEKHPGFLNPKRYLTPQPRECHNDFLEHLVEFGLIGFGIFITFLGFVYYNGFSYLSITGSLNFLLMLFLLTNLTTILINAFFFFALRLPSSGINFWLTTAMIVALSCKASLVLPSNWMIGVIIGLMAIGFLWSCIAKRTVASYHFFRYGATNNEQSKGYHLTKTLEYAPYDTLYITHACIACMDYEPALANFHAARAAEHFDGQTPAWSTLFNAGLARARTQNIFDEAEIYLKNSARMLPNGGFEPTRQLLTGPDSVSIRAKLIDARRAIMRKAAEEVVWQVRALKEKQENIILKQQNLELEKQNLELAINNVAIQEMKRLNIPDSWIFNIDQGAFLTQDENNNIVKNKEGEK